MRDGLSVAPATDNGNRHVEPLTEHFVRNMEFPQSVVDKTGEFLRILHDVRTDPIRVLIRFLTLCITTDHRGRLLAVSAGPEIQRSKRSSEG